jgi:transposase-like protein
MFRNYKSEYQLGRATLKNRNGKSTEHQEYYCEVCGREISKEDYEQYDGMCWQYWDDQLTEESDTMFDGLM